MQGRRILVAGCGYVGSRLARMLVEAGAEVFTLRRSRVEVVVGATPLRADLGRHLDPAVLPQRLHGVVFSAAPSTPDEAGYRRIFAEGLGNLIRALTAGDGPPPRLVFTSSTAVYGQSDGEWVDEASATEPRRFNGRVLLEAEAMLHASPLAGCALRLGGIYGPGRIRRIEQVRAGSACLAPGGAHYTNRIHLEDAAGAIMHLLGLNGLDRIYLGVDHEPAADNDFLRFLAGELGLPEPPTAEAPPTRRAGSKRCRNDRLVASGYRFAYPCFREGYRALMRAAPS